jgi:hypothetical protein
MIEETHHFVLSRFERTRNSLDRILTILFFLEERGICIVSFSLLYKFIRNTLIQAKYYQFHEV